MEPPNARSGVSTPRGHLSLVAPRCGIQSVATCGLVRPGVLG
jgi:hypothetical protein